MMSDETVNIVCPKCQSDFDVPEKALGERGRNVMCSECDYQWFHLRNPEPIPPKPAPKPKPPAPTPEPAPEPASESIPEKEAPPKIESVTPEEETEIVREKVSFFATQIFLVPVLCGLLFTGLFFGKNEIVRFVPGAEKIYTALGIRTYNISAFRFHNPNWKIVETGNLKSITVSGQVMNTSDRLSTPPAIQVTLRGKGICKSLSWTDQLFNKDRGRDGSCVLSRWTFRLKEGRLFSGQTSTFEMTYPVGLNQKPTEVLLKFINTD